MDEPDSSKQYRTRIHLINGGVLEGIVIAGPLTSENEPITLMEVRERLADKLATSEGWQVNTETARGWVCAPKQSVLYLEIVEATNQRKSD